MLVNYQHDQMTWALERKEGQRLELREVFNRKYGRKRTIECYVDRERADGDW